MVLLSSMAVRKTIQIGDPRLHTKAKRVSNPQNPSIKRIITDLVDTMRHEELVGMAAPQLGKMERIFVTEIRKTKYRKTGTDRLRIFINPQIIWFSKRQVKIYEGCGSVRGLFGEVRRPERVEVAYTDEKGLHHKEKFDGLLARVIQHENDHLDGILFVERVTDLKTLMDREHYLNMVRKRTKSSK